MRSAVKTATPFSRAPGNTRMVTPDDIDLAAFYAARLKDFGEAFTTGRNEEALRGFRDDWLQIKLSFDRVSSTFERRPEAARICVDFVNNKGLWLLDIHRPVSERLSWYETARTAALQIGDHQSLVIILHNLGIAMLNLGKPLEAIAFHKEQLVVARRINHAVGIAQATSSVGSCYRHMGQYRQALGWHKKVLLLKDTEEIAHVRLNAVGNTGITLLLLRRPEAACEYLETTLEMTRRLDRKREEAYAIGYLGQALQDMGRPEKALERHKQALEISRKLGDRFGEARAFGGMGNALLDLGDLAQALTDHREQLRLAEITAQPTAIASALADLGISLLYNNEKEEADAARQETVRIYKKMGNQSALAALNERWSIACEKKGRCSRAISFCKGAIELSMKNNLPGVRALRRRLALLQKPRTGARSPRKTSRPRGRFPSTRR